MTCRLLVVWLFSVISLFAGGYPACSDDYVPELKAVMPWRSYKLTDSVEITRGATTWETVARYVARDELIVKFSCEEDDPENPDNTLGVIHILYYPEDERFLLLEVRPNTVIDRIWVRRR
jgi:hypothetical protein